MKKKKLICALILCLSIPPLSSSSQTNNKPIVIQNTIIIEDKPTELKSLNPKSQKWMRALAEREWITQNETSIKALSSQDYFNNGVKKYHSKDYLKAISDFSKAIEINQEYSVVGFKKDAKPEFCYYYRGYAKLKTQDYLGAIQDFTKTIELTKMGGNSAEIYYDRGLAKYYAQDYLGAIEDYDFALSINPNLAIAQKTVGDSFIDYKSQIISAENSFETRLNQNNKVAVNYITESPVNNYILDVFCNIPSYEQDQHFIKQYINTDDKEQKEKFDIAVNNYMQAVEKYYNAEHQPIPYRVKCYNDSINLYDHLAEAYYKRGNGEFLTGDYEKALTDYDKAIAIKPILAVVYSNRGLLKYSLKDFSGALEDLKQYHELSPKDVNAHVFIGNAEREMGNYAEAIKKYNDFEKASVYLKLFVGTDEEKNLLYNNLGILYLKTGDNKKALDSFKKALCFEYTKNGAKVDLPKNMYVYNNLAIVEILSKKPKKALLYSEKARTIALGNNDMKCYEKSVSLINLAKAHLGLKDTNKINKKISKFSAQPKTIPNKPVNF